MNKQSSEALRDYDLEEYFEDEVLKKNSSEFAQFKNMIMRCYHGDWTENVMATIASNKSIQWYLESVQTFELPSLHESIILGKELFSTSDKNGVLKAFQCNCHLE